MKISRTSSPPVQPGSTGKAPSVGSAGGKGFAAKLGAAKSEGAVAKGASAAGKNEKTDRAAPVSDIGAALKAGKLTPQAAIDKVAASIREFGWQQPIVVDGADVVVAGHVRLLAARQLGEKTVPVHVATGLTPGQIQAFRLMDNRSHEETGWDLELLGLEMAELQELNVDVSLTGFDAGEISKLIDSKPESAEPVENAGETAPEPNRCPKCGFPVETDSLP